MPISEFFYEATRYIERELRGKTTKYDISHDVYKQPGIALVERYRTDPDSIRKTNVSIVIAALKVKCKQQGKDALLTHEDMKKIFKTSRIENIGKFWKNSDWVGEAKKILEKKPLVVLLLRHFQRVMADKLEFYVKEGTLDSWQIPEYLIIQDGENHKEENEKKVVTLLIGFINNQEEMKSLEPKGVPRFLIDLMAFIEQPENRGIEGIYRKPGVKSRIAKLRVDYDEKGAKSLKDISVHDVTSALKQFLRDLDEKKKDVDFVDKPVVEALINIKQNIENKTERAAKVRAELRKIPVFKLNILIYFINHLNRLSKFKTTTKMDASNLANMSGLSWGLTEGIEMSKKDKDKLEIWNELIKDFIEEPDLYF